MAEKENRIYQIKETFYKSPVAKWLARASSEKIADHYFNPLITFGAQNLQEVKRIHKTGKKIVFMINHLSNSDYLVFLRGLQKEGFWEITDNLFVIKGKKIARNHWFIDFLSRGWGMIEVWPETIQPKDDKEKRDKAKTNTKALKTSIDCMGEGNYLAIFPEGQRSRTGGLIKPSPEIAGFLFLFPDTAVVPVAITDTEKILPVKGQVFPKPGSVTINFGQPIAVSQELYEKYRRLQKNRKNGDNLEELMEMRKRVSDDIMIKIKDLLPEKYHGEYAGKYELSHLV